MSATTMHTASLEAPTDLHAKLVYFRDMDGSWNYTLAWYRNGRWLETFDEDDISCPGIEYWADVPLPN